MKIIKAKELVAIMAGKLGIHFEADNFADFRTFIDDIYSQFTDEWKNLDDEAYAYNVNVPDRNIKISTAVMKEVYEETDIKFDWTQGSADFFDDDNYSEPNSTPLDFQGEYTCINYVDSIGFSTAEFLSYWQDVCKRFDCEVNITAGTDDECSYCKHKLEWNINASKIESDESFFEINDKNAEDLMGALYWLIENFRRDTFADFENMGVELRYIGNNELNSQGSMVIDLRDMGNNELNGQGICLMYKYGDKTVFDSYEKCFELVKKCPIVYTSIPEEYKDKKMTLAVLEANNEWVDIYRRKFEERNLKDAEKKFKERDLEDIENRFKNLYVGKDRENYAYLSKNAIISSGVDFGAWLKDFDVLLAASENCFFNFTKASYDEAAVVEVLKTKPLLMCRVYEFWRSNISKHRKESERTRVKYALYNKPSRDELAFFKCYSLIDLENIEALMQLFNVVYIDFDAPRKTDNQAAFKKIFSLIDADTQNSLVNLFYYFANYVKKDVLDPVLQDEIANNCPIAGDILSDEAILKYNLTQSENDKKMRSTCEDCMQCQMNCMRIV